ncbi:AAA family ATPase [Streptomyces sp. H10-C2]|uniref:helix-turn-helix transcriptional regulator n=1 Tax=unclassified Streptomyces TaxID=2593676 RepID=UPI0024B927FD|nr:MULTISPECIES: helix-turn-helix transcriptional regulator [unclassified Streptomyces]MDJ0341405.1 AAA family ATPase [Streptomyces sp. PH10-H1]MDJ0369062.1 AAA family ATPase [Streptomyces sp. H10-C2]
MKVISATALSDPRAMLSSVQTQSVSPVFVGRDSELTRLASALARADAGEPQALVIGGEAGVGKTRLTEEFLCAAAAVGAVTAVGGCVEIGADGLPFAPVATALRSLYRQLGDELTAAAGNQAGELSRLLPELGEHHQVSRESHDDDGRIRLFELTARLLERLAADRTVVLVLEDMHWGDRSTRELLAYLFRSLHRGRLVVVATYRSDDIHRRHPLRPFLAELDRMRTVGRIELSRFSRAEVRCQITGIMAAEPKSDLVDRVFDRSDGNPFFVEELAVSIQQGCATGLSDSLRDLLLVRLETLPEDAQRAARIVAEGGTTVEYPLLAAVAGLSEDDLIEALRACVGANILLPSDDGDGYRFRHSLVREAVSDDLLPGERSRINRRYAQALEAGPGLVRTDERAARLASYWYNAHDPAKALPAVLRASVEARHRHAYAEQHGLLERALDLWDDAPEEIRAGLRPADYAEVYPPCGCHPDTPLSFLDLLAEITVSARLSGEPERAFAVTKRALRLIDESDALRAAWFRAQRSRLVQDLGRGDGWEDVARAQELVRDLPPSAVHADVLAFVAGWTMIHKSGAEGIATAERAMELARQVGARETELNARLTLGLLHVDSGDVEGGLALAEDVCREARELGLPGLIGRAHGNLASALEGIGRSREAVAVSVEGGELVREIATRSVRAYLRGNEGESLFSLGLWERSEAAVQWSRTNASGLMAAGEQAMYLAFLAVRRGQTERAEEYAQAARESFLHDSQPQHLLPIRTLTLEIAARRGRFAEARAALSDGLDAGFVPGTSRYAWPMLAAGAAAEADAPWMTVDDQDRAQLLRRIRATAAALPRLAPVWDAYALLVDAELARAEGHAAPGQWAATARAFEPLERPYELTLARYRWAEALLATGHETGEARETRETREEAGALLALAHAGAEALGARPLADEIALLAQRARLSLREHAVHAGHAGHDRPRTSSAADEPVDPAEALGLTARERDVLRLVTDGRTNRQIAEELFISPKTASVHVSNILAKLSVSGRGEAAALAHRLRLFTVPSV